MESTVNGIYEKWQSVLIKQPYLCGSPKFDMIAKFIKRLIKYSKSLEVDRRIAQF